MDVVSGIPELQHKGVVATFDKWLAQRGEELLVEGDPEFGAPTGGHASA